MPRYDKIPTIVTCGGNASMSAIIAVCGTNYAIISGDSRLVELDNGKFVKIINENTQKVFKLNDSTIIGITGDYIGLELVVKNILRRDNSFVTSEQIIQDIYNLFLGYTGFLPTNILVAGKGTNGVFFIAELTQRDNYWANLYIPFDKQHQVRLCIPEINDSVSLQSINERVERLQRATTLDQMQNRVENLIKNIANKSDTVNKMICTEMIV